MIHRMSRETEFGEIDPEQRPRIEGAWTRIESRIASLPSPLREAGEDFLARRRPGGCYRDYFSTIWSTPICYLPLWLRESLTLVGAWPSEAGSDWMEEIISGTMWGYFYIRIQDDHLDERTAPRDDLLFGNVCIAEMARNFSATMLDRRELEIHLCRAWEDFTNQTLSEAKQLRSNHPYSRECFEQHATKVAFARVPLIAVSLKANKPELIPSAVRLVDALGVTFGLLNDALGFPRDVNNGQRTFLLAQAGWQKRPTSGAPELAKPPEAVLSRLFEGGVLANTEEEIEISIVQVLEIAAELGIEAAVQAWVERLRPTLQAWASARRRLALVRAASR